MYDFELARPTTLAEALEMLAEEGSDPLSGGQTLIPSLRARLAMPERLVSLMHIDELKGIEQRGDALHVKGGTTHAQLVHGAYDIFPGLASLAGRIGDPAVRTRGTIGGSVANNDPAACYPAAALATGATIHTSQREVAADDFFLGLFETALEEGEIVTGVTFPIPQASAYEKFIQPASHFALAAVFVARFDTRVGVAVTGASEDGAFRWKEAEAALTEDFSVAALEGLSLPEQGLIADVHGGADYRARMAGVMLRRAVAALA
ncbi:FAD binding domain-containing protein [Pseudoroseicyclus tamaricis]|uniref:Carbon monoxide dehydrogenase n=1 Tax=Pseudoroseicyclus tamaricis TaxID=2705421 RepID=A0A6B2JUC3_9RHOB|nr:FAD binding domain-containing protein [Pseudoroseicyclus tamaricis]NDV01660.1 carbon monoxide dehydrogenase [Pseudoroseicyclus tamaricis]